MSFLTLRTPVSSATITSAASRISLGLLIFLIAQIRYAAGRASRSVSSWMPTAIFVRADECCRL